MPQQTPRVAVSPEMMSWAVRYSRREDYLRGKYPKLDAWIEGTVQPTLRQVQDLAKDTRVPEGWFFCSGVPDIGIDLPDMRTVGDAPVEEPSPDLVDTVFTCQRRQEWYADYAASNGLDALGFVGSFDRHDSPVDAAADMRRVLGFGPAARKVIARDRYRSDLARRAEDAGVLVMISGIVGLSTLRKLDPTEFRGFSISHEVAPLVFVNGADSLGAQLFTLAHELAHIWLGQSGVSAPEQSIEPDHSAERWCNAVAAEFLVPMDELREVVGDTDPLDAIPGLSRHFKVSNMVLLRRLHHSDLINSPTFHRLFAAELRKDRNNRDSSSQGGSDFYVNLLNRVSRTFARSVYLDARSGNTLYADAYKMLGLSKRSTLEAMGEKLGVKL